MFFTIIAAILYTATAATAALAYAIAHLGD